MQHIPTDHDQQTKTNRARPIMNQDQQTKTSRPRSIDPARAGWLQIDISLKFNLTGVYSGVVSLHGIHLIVFLAKLTDLGIRAPNISEGLHHWRP